MSYLNTKEAVEQANAITILVGSLFTADSVNTGGIEAVKADLVKAIREQIKPLLPTDKASPST